MTMPKSRPEGAPPETIERQYAGNTIERWAFDKDCAALRCFWPTAAAASRLSSEAQQRKDYSAVSVLNCYIALLTHPAGTESMVQRLRALRRAERMLEDET
jgi:hypothetical protein